MLAYPCLLSGVVSTVSSRALYKCRCLMRDYLEASVLSIEFTWLNLFEMSLKLIVSCARYCCKLPKMSDLVIKGVVNLVS